jgi:hypothetical protein
LGYHPDDAETEDRNTEIFVYHGQIVELVSAMERWKIETQKYLSTMTKLSSWLRQWLGTDGNMGTHLFFPVISLIYIFNDPMLEPYMWNQKLKHFPVVLSIISLSSTARSPLRRGEDVSMKRYLP